MGRRKIRNYKEYTMRPEEDLSQFLPIKWVVTKPLRGPGSGRAGGARSAVHLTSHVRRHGVDPRTPIGECPICRYGLKLWDFWQDPAHTHREEWAKYWESEGEEAIREFERFMSNYEADLHLKDENCERAGMENSL